MDCSHLVIYFLLSFKNMYQIGLHVFPMSITYIPSSCVFIPIACVT